MPSPQKFHSIDLGGHFLSPEYETVCVKKGEDIGIEMEPNGRRIWVNPDDTVQVPDDWEIPRFCKSRRAVAR